jgi:hypothetical protein
MTSKVENLVFYKQETAVLFAEGFAEKFLFWFQTQSWPRSFSSFYHTPLEKEARLSLTYESRYPCVYLGPHQIEFDDLFSRAFWIRPDQKKALDLFTQVARRWRDVPDACVEVQENIQQRSMTYVWKCKRTSSSVA